jgi:hypothetical protein
MDEITRNKIKKGKCNDIGKIKDELTKFNNLFVVELDETSIHSWTDYIEQIQTKFQFPTSCLDSWDRYLDWIRDLDWLNKDGYVLII